mmetsp:Transcript_35856/g.54992  ORF Transcript_35856/g.54992 Transcript_35856/m.54992 type:complete len:190 (+) Transcript_35856:1224-1793(+)|eukprot:CAMPEP_0170501232 /NCGR_PEP_ID=MMETSP0208-20121228/37635_1 /TAXON_ID=197538 /ORGANISM="Strombidium inclinatum, Strain S3" /LENGTH=189 /DNA_ID=CAMNT_0010779667 /DNA_START=1152 /DNA_END=1721 /DNA_ORIENTATION=-
MKQKLKGGVSKDKKKVMVQKRFLRVLAKSIEGRNSAQDGDGSNRFLSERSGETQSSRNQLPRRSAMPSALSALKKMVSPKRSTTLAVDFMPGNESLKQQKSKASNFGFLVPDRSNNSSRRSKRQSILVTNSGSKNMAESPSRRMSVLRPSKIPPPTTSGSGAILGEVKGARFATEESQDAPKTFALHEQ